MKVSVVGLGKIGSCILGTIASKGIDVIGVDINKEVVETIKKGKSPYFEPWLDSILKENMDRITVTNKHEAIADTDLTIIMVQTPSLPDGSFSTEYIETAILECGRVIPDDKKYHNFIITSTILPGVIDSKIIPLLERVTNKKIGENIGLCYVPEFIAIGSIIMNILKPDFVIIGESDIKAGDNAHELYQKITRSDYLGKPSPPIHRMPIINAELAKIALNVYVTMKISFANTIAEICENMPNGNAEQVLEAIGSDSRIGKKFLKPGLSYGGTCFPRDNKAFKNIADKFKSQDFLSQMAEVVNIQQIQRMTTIILKALSEADSNKLAVLGVTYKPDTNLTVESASLKIIENLIDNNVNIKVYDPAIKHGFDDLPDLKHTEFYESAKDALKDTKVAFIATPWKQFFKMKKEDFINEMNDEPFIIDGWGILKKLRKEPEIKYMQIGVNRL